MTPPRPIIPMTVVFKEKEPDEELDENNQKLIQNIVRNFLYYSGSIDPTM